jgi:hypothetical protein
MALALVLDILNVDLAAALRALRRLRLGPLLRRIRCLWVLLLLLLLSRRRGRLLGLWLLLLFRRARALERHLCRPSSDTDMGAQLRGTSLVIVTGSSRARRSVVPALHLRKWDLPEKASPKNPSRYDDRHRRRRRPRPGSALMFLSARCGHARHLRPLCAGLDHACPPVVSRGDPGGEKTGAAERRTRAANGRSGQDARSGLFWRREGEEQRPCRREGRLGPCARLGQGHDVLR